MSTLEKSRFTGVICGVQGYFGFIKADSIRREDGTNPVPGVDPDISENVFVHKDDFTNGARLEVGLRVSFTVAPDPRREGCFRAHDVKAAKLEIVPAPGGAFIPGLAVGGAMVLHEGGSIWDAKQKPVPEGTERQAHQNHGLAEVPQDAEETTIQAATPQELEEYLRAYLFDQFASLHVIDGMDYHVTGVDEAVLDRVIEEAVASYREDDMGAMVAKIEEEYARFKQTKRFLTWILERGWLTPGSMLSPTILAQLVELVSESGGSVQKAEHVDAVQKCVDFMNGQGLLNARSVLPWRVFPEIFMAVPVEFLVTSDQASKQKVRDTWREDDPLVHPAVKFQCSLFNNARWMDTVQMFNRRMRVLPDYDGDVIPTRVRHIMRAAAEVFDWVLILTPYHDRAGKDWSDLTWIRSIDPYVIGIKEGLPVFFFLARYSDQGLFPRYETLLADTIEFLRANKDALLNFNVVTMPYWAKPGNLNCCVGCLGTKLYEHAGQLLRAFEQGILFPWLRGEAELSELTLDASSEGDGQITSGPLPDNDEGPEAPRTVTAEIVDQDEGSEAIEIEDAEIDE